MNRQRRREGIAGEFLSRAIRRSAAGGRRWDPGAWRQQGVLRRLGHRFAAHDQRLKVGRCRAGGQGRAIAFAIAMAGGRQHGARLRPPRARPAGLTSLSASRPTGRAGLGYETTRSRSEVGRRVFFGLDVLAGGVCSEGFGQASPPPGAFVDGPHIGCPGQLTGSRESAGGDGLGYYNPRRPWSGRSCSSAKRAPASDGRATRSWTVGAHRRCP